MSSKKILISIPHSNEFEFAVALIRKALEESKLRKWELQTLESKEWSSGGKDLPYKT